MGGREGSKRGKDGEVEEEEGGKDVETDSPVVEGNGKGKDGKVEEEEGGKEEETDSPVVEGKGEGKWVKGGGWWREARYPGRISWEARGAWMDRHSCLLLSRLMNYVREQLVCSVALIIKRATLEVDQPKLFDSIFTTVSQLLTVDVSRVGR